MRAMYLLAGMALLSPIGMPGESAPPGRWALLETPIPDIRVVDQDGRVLRFYTDLVKDQTVAIQFIFTSCTTICTPLGATFHRLQELTSSVDRRLISISVDPEQDTPAELRKFADRFGARSGWTLVTGERVDIENLLKALQAFTRDKSAHSAMLLIGNDRTNRWTRAYGLSPVESLGALLREGAGGNK